MSHLWISSECGQWAVAPLAGSLFKLAGDSLELLTLERDAGSVGRSPVIRRCHSAEGERYVLLVPPGSDVYVNGEPVLTQIRVLQHRDSIYSPGAGTVYFSSERLASVEMFAGAVDAVFCPRCKRSLVPGRPVVRCPKPQCGLLHHEDPEAERCCWSYDSECGGAGCDQPTALDAGFRWVPEEA